MKQKYFQSIQPAIHLFTSRFYSPIKNAFRLPLRWMHNWIECVAALDLERVTFYWTTIGPMNFDLRTFLKWCRWLWMRDINRRSYEKLSYAMMKIKQNQLQKKYCSACACVPKCSIPESIFKVKKIQLTTRWIPLNFEIIIGTRGLFEWVVMHIPNFQ